MISDFGIICEGVKALRCEDEVLRYAIETFTECFFTFDRLRHRESFAVTELVEVPPTGCGGFVSSPPTAIERFTESFFIRCNKVSGFQIPKFTVADL